jgi:hypothetical protein
MSDLPIDEFDAVADLDARLRRDGLTLDAEDRDYLLALIPAARAWSAAIRPPETRYIDPALTHVLKPATSE